MKRNDLMGLKYDTFNRVETLKAISDSINQGVNHIYRSDINVATFMMCEKNQLIKKYINEADIINIDGMGMVFGCKFLGRDFIERIAGADLFIDLLELSEAQNFSVFFLGATDEVVTLTASKAIESYPNLDVAGFHDGYFSSHESSVVDKINICKPDILFVGIKSPEKEMFILNWKNSLNVKFIMGVGGTFDVYSGKLRRAPVWMQRIGMEWFFRLMQEPKRMWRRYLVTNIHFLWILLVEKKRQLWG